MVKTGNTGRQLMNGEDMDSDDRGEQMVNNCTIIRMLTEDNIYGSVVTHGFAIYNHWHGEMDFIYMEYGCLKIDVDETLYEVTKGQMLIVSANTMHAFMEVEKDSVIWVAKVYPKNILSSLNNREDVSGVYRNTLLLKATDRMRTVFEELIHADYGKFNGCYAGIKISELTIEIMCNKSSIKQHIPIRTVENSETIYKMQEFIEENRFKDITLTMVAEHMGFSTAYCSKYIKKKTNLNFLDYVNAIHLREAEELLQTSDISITDVSYAAGFKSVQCFNRTFKKYRGMTPTEYRKALKSKK